MAILKISEARMELAGGSIEMDETNVDERGDGREGRDKGICVEFLARHPLGQLQSAPSAAASCSGREKDAQDMKEKAAGEAATRGSLGQQDVGAAAPLRGAQQLQEPTKAAAAAAGGGTGRKREEEVATAAGIGEERAGQWRSGRAAIEAL